MNKFRKKNSFFFVKSNRKQDSSIMETVAKWINLQLWDQFEVKDSTVRGELLTSYTDCLLICGTRKAQTRQTCDDYDQRVYTSEKKYTYIYNIKIYMARILNLELLTIRSLYCDKFSSVTSFLLTQFLSLFSC